MTRSAHLVHRAAGMLLAIALAAALVPVLAVATATPAAALDMNTYGLVSTELGQPNAALEAQFCPRRFRACFVGRDCAQGSELLGCDSLGREFS